MKIKDIAKLSGVSIATVSRVLNNKSDVNEETREKIKKIIEENGYMPSTIARNLVKNENNTIGVIIPDIKNLYFSNIINEIVTEANLKNKNIILGCSNESFELQDKYIKLFIQERVEGIILVITKNSKTELKYFEKISKKIPLVFVDRKINDKFSGIFFENYNPTYQILDKMIKEGCKKIAFVTGPLDVSTAFERFEAYKKVLYNNNIQFNEKYVFYGDFTLESGYIIGEKIVKNDIDAIYISNNLMTLGFLKYVKENNIDIKKYKIATFENNEIIDFVESSIKSNMIPFKKLAISALDLIDRKFNDNIKDEIIIIDTIKKIT